ncbi:hypothetical protein [Terribacillus sp. DMT04]|uniref:hypothetical protein n=1 Tax=Terribacillus sp. DMT04 TaxID=2850441 RepID=UPI001C2BD034|nr:hypothetical protein [Terribacillus sp. DMT04]QXE02821.1 hypothetical protein KS242_06475 [Terribacillus sp. DMT04]
MEELLRKILKEIQLVKQLVSGRDGLKKDIIEIKQGQEEMKMQLDRIERKLG